MATITALKALTEYFQVAGNYSLESEGGDYCKPTIAGVPSKRAMKEWAEEVKALDPDSKRELALLAVEELNATDPLRALVLASA